VERWSSSFFQGFPDDVLPVLGFGHFESSFSSCREWQVIKPASDTYLKQLRSKYQLDLKLLTPVSTIFHYCSHYIEMQ
jgi:hypothetical protein